MAVFLSSYDPNPTKAPLTGKRIIEFGTMITKRLFGKVSRKPWRSPRRTRDLKGRLIIHHFEIPQFVERKGSTQWIKGRTELKSDTLNNSAEDHDFLTLDYLKESLDPFIYRFQKLNWKGQEKLRQYIDLTNQHPEYFARMKEATLVTETGDSTVECDGIMGARNDIRLPLFLICDKRLKIRKALKEYIYTRAKKIIELLTKNGYVVNDQNLEQHLHFWRISTRYDLRLGESLGRSIKKSLVELNFEGFLSTSEDVPLTKEIQEAEEMNKNCLETFCEAWHLEGCTGKLTSTIEDEAKTNLEEIYAYFVQNTIPTVPRTKSSLLSRFFNYIHHVQKTSVNSNF